VVPLAFLDAAGGGELRFERFEERPPPHVAGGDGLAAFGAAARARVRAWWDEVTRLGPPATVRTYYGVRETTEVLERTAWHAAQHVRQLAAVLQAHGIAPEGPLGDADLAGLPMPDEVYDDQVMLGPGPP
jgi:hypothetical protein